MKIRALIAVGISLLCFLGTSVSCGPSKAEREEAARQDSIRVADSIANAEEELRLAAIEAARQDSIEKIENFKKSLPELKDLYVSFDKVNFEKLGFTKTIKKEYISDLDFDLEDITYKLELDSDHYCIIKMIGGYECSSYSISVIGFPEIMEKYKADAKALKNSSTFTDYAANPYMEIKKNEVFWQDGV